MIYVVVLKNIFFQCLDFKYPGSLKKIRYSDEYDLTIIVFSTGLFSNSVIRTKGNIIKMISKAMLDSENLTIELYRNNIRIYK